MALRPLYHIFTAVPRRYDLINHIITLGMDIGWRRRAARKCLEGEPRRVLDLCCGTGDNALNLVRMAARDLTVVGLDYSPPMLDIAARKAAAAGRDIAFILGDAGNLPFPDGYFDGVGISFAFRNLTYKNPRTKTYLAEVRRVLADGGRFVIVESSQPESSLMRWLFHVYLRWFVFRAGYCLSGNREAYIYLAESAARFFTPAEVEALLLGAGFSRFSFQRLFFGAAAIYVAVK